MVNTAQNPNLFNYATKELSQDAFVCWLLSWSATDTNGVDTNLHQVAMEFLNAMLVKHGASPVTKPTIRIRTQHKGADILVEVNHDVVLLIEDKTHSTEHSDQLGRYFLRIKEDFPERQIFPIFLKTGDQSSYKNVQEAGYALFLRDELLKVLRKGHAQGIVNNIYVDFLQHLEMVQQRVDSYKILSPAEWGNEAWIGFYKFLQLEKKGAHWGYVPNPRGGFWGMWWHGQKWLGSEIYLQIEQGDLCFKLCVQEKEKWKTLRDQLHQALLNAEGKGENKLALVKPNRFGLGNCMTAAIVKQQNWLSVTEAGHLDASMTMSNLAKAELMLERISKLTT